VSWIFELEAFSFSVVETSDSIRKLCWGDHVEVERLREILPQEPIGILICTSLPSVIWICKIYGHSGFLFETFPVTKLSAIVESDSLSFLLWDMSEVFERKRGEKFSVHFGKKKGDQISASAVDKRNDAHPFVPPHERVTLKVSESSPSLDDVRPLINTPFLPLFSFFFSCLGAPSSSVLAFLRSQILLQMRSAFFDVSVDGAWSNRLFSLGKSAGNLLG